MKWPSIFTAIILALGLRINAQELLVYHPIQTDFQGYIIPWYHPEPGIAYDHVIGLTWRFWKNMRKDDNGLPYYMNHQVWKPDVNDPRGIGGDQLQMALSAWRLYYAYTGDESVKDNMKFMADYYLSHSLSPPTALWPNLPFPYNTLVYSGQYDGDMVLGKDYTQPDKAASFGLELVHLYKLTQGDFFFQTTSARYLDAAISIARTLVERVQPGDEHHSPWPFKVHVYSGEVGALYNNYTEKKITGYSNYTTNYVPALELFLALEALDPQRATLYRKTFQTVLSWMKTYPLLNQKWGPFFEDVYDWSDTQINAVTFAEFILNHRDYFPHWQSDCQRIFD